jgi:hypothetical protein
LPFRNKESKVVILPHQPQQGIPRNEVDLAGCHHLRSGPVWAGCHYRIQAEHIAAMG